MTTDILARLNAYTGDNIWQDIILRDLDIDDTRLAELDPSGASDVIPLESGPIIRYDHQGGQWYEATQ